MTAKPIPAEPTAAAPTAPWLAAQTRQLLTQRGHAWLLQGPSGLGQFDLALALARAWLCDAPSADGACGRCASCHAIDVHAHADLMVLMPETQMLARGWPLPEKAQADIDDKKRKPSKEIRVEAMRDVVEFAQRTSARGRGLVVLVYPAERMNAITANALLKTLEEPSGHARFALASDAAHLLLPTIRSRCQTHTLHWPDAAAALAWLATQGLAGEAAHVLLRAAGGRPQDALALAQRGLDAPGWAALPRALAKGQPGALAATSAAQTLDALQKLCHDLLAAASGAAPRFFQRQDLPRHLGPSALPALTAWSRELAQALQTAEHPWHAELQRDVLVNRARQAMRAAVA